MGLDIKRIWQGFESWRAEGRAAHEDRIRASKPVLAGIDSRNPPAIEPELNAMARAAVLSAQSGRADPADTPVGQNKDGQSLVDHWHRRERPNLPPHVLDALARQGRVRYFRCRVTDETYESPFP